MIATLIPLLLPSPAPIFVRVTVTPSPASVSHSVHAAQMAIPSAALASTLAIPAITAITAIPLAYSPASHAQVRHKRQYRSADPPSRSEEDRGANPPSRPKEGRRVPHSPPSLSSVSFVVPFAVPAKTAISVAHHPTCPQPSPRCHRKPPLDREYPWGHRGHDRKGERPLGD